MKDIEKNKKAVVSKVEDSIESVLKDHGYELVYIEIISHHKKTLRLFIDHLNPLSSPIGSEDCVKVSQTLDTLLDIIPEVDEIFHGSYDLEVSSPGIERPLRKLKDFDRFKNQRARIQLFRPLTSTEIQNNFYHNKNPKQKNFIGIILGLDDTSTNILFRVDSSHSASKKQKKNTETELPDIKIPFELVSKANLEPALQVT